MSKNPNKKIPPKGSFSMNYAGSIRGLQVGWQEVSKDEMDLSQEITEMCQFAHMAIQKTSEVQDDITRLLESWDLEGKIGDSEVEVLNARLVECGFKPVRVVSLSSFVRVTLEALAEIQVLRNDLVKAKAYLDEQARTADFYKDQKKDLENQIRMMNKSEKNNAKQPISDKQFYNTLKVVLECESKQDIIKKAKSFKTILGILPKFEEFIEEICKEFVTEVDYNKGFKVHPEALSQVFDRIRGLKRNLQDLSNFKINVYALLDMKISGNDEVVYSVLKEIMRVKAEFGLSECRNFVSFFGRLGKFVKDAQSVFREIAFLNEDKTGGFMLIEKAKKLAEIRI